MRTWPALILALGLAACSPASKRHHEPSGRFSYVPPPRWIQTMGPVSRSGSFAAFQGTAATVPFGRIEVMETGLASATEFAAVYDRQSGTNETVIATVTLETAEGVPVTRITLRSSEVDGSVHDSYIYHMATIDGGLLFVCAGGASTDVFDPVIRSFRWEREVVSE